MQQSTTQGRIWRLILFTVALLLVGTVGYMELEGYSLIEGFYMTAITLTTTGFGEVRPLSAAGRLFTIVLLFLGVGVLGFALSTVVGFVMRDFSGQLARRRMQRSIEELTNHIVICGYGRVGGSARSALSLSGYELVIIERDNQLAQMARAEGLLVLEGDATSDDMLRAAGVERAAGLLVTTGDDAVNLFVVLSAHALNPSLFIVARSANRENERKMRQAGANRVVSPHRIGGQHMANIVIRPHVTDFLDVVTLDNGQELWLEEFVLPEGSPLCSATIGQANIRERIGVTIVAIVREKGGSTITPRAGTLLEAGDQLIVLGTRDQLTALEVWMQPDALSAPPLRARRSLLNRQQDRRTH
jgi:voltage-gated potassium channel